MSDEPVSLRQSWVSKFRNAFHGVKVGVRGQSSFFVHFFFAVVVIVAGLVLRVSAVDWCLLLLCIAGVLTTEMFNSALESMALSITDNHNPHLGDALDIGSAAVLLASIGAVAVGAIVFLRRLGVLLGWF